MSVQYNNFKIILEKNEFLLETTKEEFMKNKILFIKCKEGHITENKNTSFVNKCSSYQNKKNPSLCGKCNLRIPIIEKLEKRMNELNFKLIEFDENNMDLIYQCGNCKNENKSNKNSMLKKSRTNFCSKCQNNKYKLEYEYIKNEFKKRNFLLVTKQDEYKSNKDLLNYICSCGNQSKISLSDLRRERKCIFCKDDRYKKTIIEKYGVHHMFQNEQMKEKIKQTNIQKYGVEYPNQNVDIFKKGLQSSFTPLNI
jgi:predicted CXXCH cytochrome family protein